MRFSLSYTGIRNCPLKIEIFQLPDGFRLNRLVGDWLLKVANIKDKSNGATVYAPGGGGDTAIYGLFKQFTLG